MNREYFVCVFDLSVFCSVFRPFVVSLSYVVSLSLRVFLCVLVVILVILTKPCASLCTIESAQHITITISLDTKTHGSKTNNHKVTANDWAKWRASERARDWREEKMEQPHGQPNRTELNRAITQIINSICFFVRSLVSLHKFPNNNSVECWVCLK